MKNLTIVVLAILLLSTPLWGQAAATVSTGGTINAAGASCGITNCVRLILPSGAATAVITTSGTYVATGQFEATQNGTTYGSITSTGGASSTNANATYTFAVAGYKAIQLRGSAYTSGSMVVVLSGATAPSGQTSVTNFVVNAADSSFMTSNPNPIALASSADPTIGVIPKVDPTTREIYVRPGEGATPYSFISTASVNLTNVKASPGTLYSVTLINPTASVQYVRLYNKASAPDPSACSANTDCPVIYSPIPTQGTTNGSGFTIPIGPLGWNFSNGIGYSISGAACTVVSTCTDETNALAGVTIILGYK